MPAKVSVETVIGFVWVSVAVSVIFSPAPVKPSTPDKLPIAKLEAVCIVKLPAPTLPASTLMTALEPESE